MFRPLVSRRTLALTQITKSCIRQQIRSAQIVNARFFQSRIEPRVLDRYKKKLEKKVKSEGVRSIDELKEAYKEKIEAVRKEAHVPEVEAVLGTPLVPPASNPTSQSQQNLPFAPPPKPVIESPIASAARAASAPLGVKTLASYVDADKLAAHTDPKDIEFIWRARFVGGKTSLCAVIPADTYRRMEKVGRRYPMFVLPLPREGQGVEMHFLQWTFPHEHSSTIIFTSLAEYKLRGEFANPHTTLTHHLELLNTRNLVLAQGTVVSDRGVKLDEAQWLLMAIQKFYGAIEGEDAKRRQNMLKMFSQGDANFSIEKLIEEVELIA